MHQIRLICQHRQRFDFAAVGEAAAIVAVKLGGDITRLHHDHAHARVAMQFFRGDRQRRNIAFVPIQNHQPLRAVPGGGGAGFHHHALVSFR